MSNRKFSINEYNDRHFKKVEKFTAQVDIIYQTAIREATIASADLVTRPDREFRFEDYPKTQERINELLRRMALDLVFTIQLGQETEWNFADEKNDALVESVFANRLPKPKPTEADPLPVAELPARYLSRNEEALKAFQGRKVAGLGLSQRVFNYTGQFKRELEMSLDVGLGQGKSASQMSRDVRAYLTEPEKLFRRVRTKRGNLALSKAAKDYHPGQGVYRSSYKNAMRLTRTEINAAYRESDHTRWQNLDFVVGFEVRRSNNTVGCDVCEALKGKYPKTFKFVGWHPQCRCNVVSILATGAELRKLTQNILAGDDTAGFVSENEVTDLPDNFKQWASENQAKLEKAKTPPLFMADNIKNGKFKLSVPTPTGPLIDLSKFIAGDVPTNKEVKSVIAEFVRLHPDTMPQGLESVSILASKSYLMQHSRLYTSSTNQWKGASMLSISSHGFSLGGSVFNPAEEFRGALGAIKAGTPLSFNQEYAVEGLWHEFLHGKSRSQPRKLSSIQLEAMETLNQFTARHTYDTFLKPFGVVPQHKQAILDNGYGYRAWVSNFRAKLTKLGISEQKALTDLYPALMGDYAEIAKTLKAYLK